MFRVYDDYSPMIAIISELQGHTTDESRPLHQHADVQVRDSPDNALSHGKQTSPTATANILLTNHTPEWPASA